VCVNNLSEVALDSAAAGIEPATSSRKYHNHQMAASSLHFVDVGIPTNFDLLFDAASRLSIFNAAILLGTKFPVRI